MKIETLNITAFTATFKWDVSLKESLDCSFELALTGGDENLRRSIKGRNALTLSGLKPETPYTGTLQGAGQSCVVSFTTPAGKGWSPAAFGAKGDGNHDDTAAFQAAIACVPDGGYLVVTKGVYRLKPIFLKSRMTLVLEEGAQLMGEKDPALYPVIPGLNEEKIYGSWEGLENSIYAALITAVGCEDLAIVGEGIIDGNADWSNWWHNPKMKEPAARPRLVYLSHCNRLTLTGVTIRNSPSWTLHPFCCDDLLCANLKIQNPADSPNTDGLNPEFCRNVIIDSVHFSVGDDCIAIKAGKKALADRIPRNTRNVLIQNCLMERGHGAVVLGSEMSGGIEQVTVKDCLFIDTDRGIRLKTRRGRGGAVRDIRCESVSMRNVGSAFVFNMFYFCDPDGKSDAVQNKNARPVDEGTPSLEQVSLKNIEIDGVRHSLLFMYGLPEHFVKDVTLENISATIAEGAEPDVPAMMCDIDPMTGCGLFLRNVENLKIDGMSLDGFTESIEQVKGLRIDGRED